MTEGGGGHIVHDGQLIENGQDQVDISTEKALQTESNASGLMHDSKYSELIR